MGFAIINRIIAPYRQLLETISRRSKIPGYHMVPRDDLNAGERADCKRMRVLRDLQATLAGGNAFVSLGSVRESYIRSESNSDVVKDESALWLIVSAASGGASAMNLALYAVSNSEYRRKCLIMTPTPAAQAEEDRARANFHGNMFRSLLPALDNSTINASAALAAGSITRHSIHSAAIGAKISAAFEGAAAVSTAVFLPFFVPPPERSSDPTM